MAKLKTVEASNEPPPPPKTGDLASTLARAMEARRVAIKEENHEEPDADFEDDWE